MTEIRQINIDIYLKNKLIICGYLPNLCHLRAMLFFLIYRNCVQYPIFFLSLSPE